MIFRSYLSLLYIRIDVRHQALRNFATIIVNVVEEMVGTREAEAAVATESGGAATTGDATAGDDTVATYGVMYAAEGPYTIDVRHVEAMVGTTREAADGDRVRRGRDSDETRNETGGPRDEIDDKTAATAGDVMYTDEGELKFDEDELAALEGHRLVAEFRCGIY